MVKIDLQKTYSSAIKLASETGINVNHCAKEVEEHSEAELWRYLSSQGRTNSAFITKPVPINKAEASVEKQSKEAASEVIEAGAKKACLTSLKDLTPIKSKEEYLEALERIKNAKTETGERLWQYEEDLKHYPNATEIEQGLLPYCGHRDISDKINKYLSGRIEPTAEMQDVVRVLDYSLKELNKEFGEFEGIVYRQGFMGEKTGQYLSTSKNPLCAARLSDGWFDPYDVKYRTYSVIKTKGGHDLSAFQSKMKDGYCNKEQEILLPHEAQYREVPINECSEDLLKAREDLASKLFRDAHKVFDGGKSEIKGYTKEDLLDLVKIYEEV